MVQAIQNALPLQVALGAVPPEGPMAIAFNVDFSQGAAQVIDFTMVNFGGRISMIQTIYVDNSLNTVPAKITCPVSNQTMICPANSQGYFPAVLTTGKLGVTLQSASGAVIPFQALNVAMNASVWSVNTPPTTNTGGALIVSDPALESTVSGGTLAAQEFGLSGDGVTKMARVYGTRCTTLAWNSTAAQTIVTGAPGWVLTGLLVTLDPNSTLAAAGLVGVTLAEAGGATLAVGEAFVGATAVTGLSAAPALINLSGEQITSKVATSALTLTASSALLVGGLRYIARFGLSPFIGG